MANKIKVFPPTEYDDNEVEQIVTETWRRMVVLKPEQQKETIVRLLTIMIGKEKW